MQQQGYFGIFMQKLVLVEILLLHCSVPGKCFAGPALWLDPVIGCVLMLDRMLTLLSEKDFVRTHENMTDCFAPIDPLHPSLLRSNKRLSGNVKERETSGENEVF